MGLQATCNNELKDNDAKFTIMYCYIRYILIKYVVVDCKV